MILHWRVYRLYERIQRRLETRQHAKTQMSRKARNYNNQRSVRIKRKTRNTKLLQTSIQQRDHRRKESASTDLQHCSRDRHWQRTHRMSADEIKSRRRRMKFTCGSISRPRAMLKKCKGAPIVIASDYATIEHDG